MKLKFTQYQLANEILLKKKFHSHLWQQYIQANAIRYKYFHNTKSPMEKDAMPLHSMTIEHPSKSRKLNGVGKIFLDLFDLSKYPLITTIHFMIDDVEAIQSFQPNGFKKFGVPYCFTLKLIDYFLQAIQKIIIKHDEDWHDRVTYQTIFGIFSFSLISNNKFSLSPNIYSSSLLLAQISQGQSFVIQFQIKYLLKMGNISTDHKEELHVYASDNIFSQISNLVSNQDKVRKTKMRNAQKLWLDPYRETW